MTHIILIPARYRLSACYSWKNLIKEQIQCDTGSVDVREQSPYTTRINDSVLPLFGQCCYCSHIWNKKRLKIRSNHDFQWRTVNLTIAFSRIAPWSSLLSKSEFDVVYGACVKQNAAKTLSRLRTKGEVITDLNDILRVRVGDLKMFLAKRSSLRARMHGLQRSSR